MNGRWQRVTVAIVALAIAAGGFIHLALHLHAEGGTTVHAHGGHALHSHHGHPRHSHRHGGSHSHHSHHAGGSHSHDSHHAGGSHSHGHPAHGHGHDPADSHNHPPDDHTDCTYCLVKDDAGRFDTAAVAEAVDSSWRIAAPRFAEIESTPLTRRTARAPPFGSL